MAHIIKRKNVLKATFAEDVSDQVGAMVTGNTETGITVTYQDSDNTLDFAVNYASQSDQETATSTTTAVNPAVQHFHPSAAKFWIVATVSAGVPSNAISYNVTSITDNGPGSLIVTIATDFSSANWCAQFNARGGTVQLSMVAASQAAGSIQVDLIVGGVGTDPIKWFVSGLGDQ